MDSVETAAVEPPRLVEQPQALPDRLRPYMFKPGNPGGPGRPPGMGNAVHRELQECFLDAFDRLGGVDYLVKLGLKRPELFMAGLIRCMPKEVNARLQVTLLERLAGRVRELEAAEPPKEIR